MVVMSTQLIGFSVGGILRRFLVQPASMSESTLFTSSVVYLIVPFTSLAYEPRDLCAIQHPSSTTIRRHRQPWWYQPREILLICVFGLVLLVLVPRLHLSSDVVLQLGLLDRPQQRRDQPALRIL